MVRGEVVSHGSPKSCSRQGRQKAEPYASLVQLFTKGQAYHAFYLKNDPRIICSHSGPDTVGTHKLVSNTSPADTSHGLN